MTADARLCHLLELADQGPALRAALAEEVAELLTDWPAGCPADMRPVFENLLAKAAREVDTATRARLRVRLYADAALAARVLPREDASGPLVEAAREGEALAERLAGTLGLDGARIHEILGEETGEALAIACKGSGLGRAAYSTLALLAFARRDGAAARLAVYDRVPTLDAARTLRSWRDRAQAAE